MKDNSAIELSIAMNDFAQSLPEVDTSLTSTFKNEVFLDHKKFIFFAQKTKSKKGMFWDIYSRESSQWKQSLASIKNLLST